MKRNRRAGVEDRWTKTVRDEHGNEKKVPSARHGQGMRWMARYVDDEGNERSKSFDRKADAQIWLDNDVTAKLATGTYVAPKAGLLTVDEMYTAWSASQGHLAPATNALRRSAWRNHVQPKWGKVSVVDVKTSAVKAWVTQMVAADVGAPTIVVAFGVLRQVLNVAVDDHRIPRNPCEGAKLPKCKHADRAYLTHAQVAALAEAATYLPEVIRFLAYTGLRWGEMASLRVCDFDMLRRRVNISRSFTEVGNAQFRAPKTGERRSVPFPASLADELAALMVGKGRVELVFTSQRGHVLRGSLYRPRVFHEAVQAVQEATAQQRARELAATGTAVTPEFPTISPHDLRHTAASLAVSAGANVKAVQRMLGHAKASMTLDVYADLFDDDLDVVADRLDAAIIKTSTTIKTSKEAR
jgi:integrase